MGAAKTIRDNDSSPSQKLKELAKARYLESDRPGREAIVEALVSRRFPAFPKGLAERLAEFHSGEPAQKPLSGQSKGRNSAFNLWREREKNTPDYMSKRKR